MKLHNHDLRIASVSANGWSIPGLGFCNASSNGWMHLQEMPQGTGKSGCRPQPGKVNACIREQSRRKEFRQVFVQARFKKFPLGHHRASHNQYFRIHNATDLCKTMRNRFRHSFQSSHRFSIVGCCPLENLLPPCCSCLLQQDFVLASCSMLPPAKGR